MKLLNVGGASKLIPIPAIYDGWEHLMLDIDPKSEADIICNAVALPQQSRLVGDIDSVYCSHNLEHYFVQDMPKVLEGFHYVLKDDGFAYIIVPHMQWVFNKLASGSDINDFAYSSPAGQITFADMIYGHAGMIERSGNEFMCHRQSFTPKSLGNALHEAGFSDVYLGVHGSNNLFAFAFKQQPSDGVLKRLNLMANESRDAGDEVVSPPLLSTALLDGAGLIQRRV
jgi:predicted SAM-dependent methyltransferase